MWQHLRTFRKRLFDAVPLSKTSRLMANGLTWPPDWAFMVPIIELATSPRHITDPLYLYEPGEPKEDGSRRERDAIVARILAKPEYAKLK